MAFVHGLLTRMAPEIVNKPGYRADIDALRGLAVAGVVLFHFFPRIWFGFLGVDIFFVISGYLISGIIFAQLEKDRFLFRDFYARRIRRLFPSLLLVLSVVFLVAWFYFLPGEFLQCMKYIIGGIFFVDNLVFYQGIDYFNPQSQTNVLLHLWSLGIEEQFYLVFPLLLFLLHKICGRERQECFSLALVLFYGVVLLGSLAWCQYVSHINEKAFYLPQARIWEIAAGGFAAALERYPAVRTFCTRFALPLVSIGFMLLLSGGAIIDHAHFPDIRAVLPVSGTAVLLLSLNRQPRICRCFAHPILIGLGLISYALYLWHRPVISLTRLLADWPSHGVRLVLMLLSVALASATFLWWERRWRFAASRLAIPMLCAGALLLAGGAGLACLLTGSEQERLASDWLPRNSMHVVFAGEDVRGKIGQKNTVLFGDSLAEQYLPRALYLCAQDKAGSRGIILIHGGHYPPYPGSLLQTREDEGFFQKFMSVCRDESVDTVIISGNWVVGFGGATWAPVLLHGKLLDPARDWDKVVAAWREVMRFLVERKKRVYLVWTNPIDVNLDYSHMFRRQIFPPRTIFDPQPADCTAIRKGWGGKARAMVKGLAEEFGAIFIDPADSLCHEGKLWPLDEAGEPICRDHGHFRASYVKNRITYLDRAFLGQ